MAYPTQITIGTGSKSSANYQSNEFSVSVTYQLERDDIDLLQFAEEKAVEMETLHGLIRHRVLELRQQPTIQQVVPNDTTSKGTTLPSNSLVNSIATSEPLISTTQKRVIERLTEQCGLSGDELKKLLICRFGRSQIGDLTTRQSRMFIAELQRRFQNMKATNNQPLPSEEN